MEFIDVIDFLHSIIGDTVSKLGFKFGVYRVSIAKKDFDFDFTTNIAMNISSHNGGNLLDNANVIANVMRASNEIFSAVQVAAPGFINFSIDDVLWKTILCSSFNKGDEFGVCDIGQGRKINVEFVSANPTGPMHVGHFRSAIIGSAIVNMLRRVGYDIDGEYYINDAGVQIDKLTESLISRYKELFGYEVQEIQYPGDYLIDCAKMLRDKYGDDLLSDENYFSIIKDFALGQMMDKIKDDLSLLDVSHNIFVSETNIRNNGILEKAIDILREKGLIYDGYIDLPKGKVVEDFEYGKIQTLFKSTDFGDDVDRSVKKSDGSWTYFASDIGYHYDKIARGYNELVVVLGRDHSGYAKRLSAVVKALSDSTVNINIVFHNIVNFVKDGVPVKMSKRAGNILEISEVIESVSVDVAKFFVLMRDNNSLIDFDLAKLNEQSYDNPVFYVNYACVRVNSLLKNIVDKIPDVFDKIYNANVSLLNGRHEKDIMCMIAGWSNCVKIASHNFEPFQICFYLQKIADLFHSYWGRGNASSENRFIVESDLELTYSRLLMAICVKNVICAGMKLLSIEPMKEM